MIKKSVNLLIISGFFTIIKTISLCQHFLTNIADICQFTTKAVFGIISTIARQWIGKDDMLGVGESRYFGQNAKTQKVTSITLP